MNTATIAGSVDQSCDRPGSGKWIGIPRVDSWGVFGMVSKYSTVDEMAFWLLIAGDTGWVMHI